MGKKKTKSNAAEKSEDKKMASKEKGKKEAEKEEEAENEKEQVEDEGDEEYDEDDDDDDELLELLQVDLGDMVKMKQVLDEAVAGAVLDQQFIEEDFHWDNFKLGLMALACGFAMVAQFVPVPFPDSRPILGVCGSAYFLLSGILQFITTVIDQDSILLTKPMVPTNETASDAATTSKAKGGKAAVPTITNPDLKEYGIRVRTNLPRFSEWYTVILELRMENPNKNSKSSSSKQSSSASSAPFHPPKVQMVWSVGQFFDKEGYFDEIGLSQEIDKIFKRLEVGEYDKALVEDAVAKKKNN